MSKLQSVEQKESLVSAITAILDTNEADSDDVEELWKKNWEKLLTPKLHFLGSREMKESKVY